MQQITSQNQGNNSFYRVIVFLFSLSALCCVSGYRGILNYLAAFFVFMILGLVLFKNKGVIAKDRKTLCIFLFMLFYTITSFVNLDLGNFIVYFIYNILIFSPIIVAGILLRTQDDLIIHRALKNSIIIWCLIGVITLITYIANPSIARLAAAYQEEYAGKVFGGYNYAFGSALLFVYLFSNLLRGVIQKSLRKYVIIFCILLFAVVYLTESSLTTFSTIIGMVVCLFIDGKDGGKNSLNKFMKIVLFLLLLFIGYKILETNVDTVMNWVNSKSDTLFVYRIGEILRSFFYSDTTGHVEKRSSLIVSSWKFFCESPLVGWGYKYGNVFSLGKQFGIGNHSEIFDILAKYGLVGGIPLFMIYIDGVKPFISKYSGLLVTLLILMTFNPFMTFQSFFILFFVIPMIEYTLGKDKYVTRRDGE